LENGDRLSRPEFERRYDAMPNVKAELIQGVAYMASPVGSENHAKPHYRVIVWLGLYSSVTPGVDGADNASVRLDMDNMPQPDAFLCLDTRCGGRVRVADDDIAENAPELIVEVASSSVSYDLNDKLQVYRRHGVPEYVVWRTRDRAVDWFVLENGNYVRLAPDAAGIYKSSVFPGLWLDPKALLEDDRATMLRVGQEGAASAEHLAFVEKLKLAIAQKKIEG
jgi:Uma2 family endonuclease